MGEITETPENMRQTMELLERELAGRRVFRYMEELEVKEIFAEEFFEKIKKGARVIIQNGLQGKHIGIMGNNSLEWIVSLCAVFWSGSAAVLLDKEMDGETLREKVRKVEIAGILYDDFVEKTIRETELPHSLMKLPFSELQKAEGTSYGSGLSCGNRNGDDLACVFFTSGTTGESKGIMMSEKGLAAGICHRVNNRRFQALLAVLPFHHLSGFSSVLNALYLGAEVCIAGDMKYFYRCLECMKPDYVFVVPSMLRMLARKLKKGGPNGRLLGWNLQMINCGGASFCPEFLQLLLEHKVTVFQGYGASEAGAIGFMWEMTLDHPDSIGKPPEDLEVKIENGELYLRSPSIMMGYYGEKEETKKVLCQGWYATGDLCRMDEEGYLYLTGRRNNLIILANGENVSPEEIEKKLYQYEDIQEAVAEAEDNLITGVIFPRYPENCSPQEEEEIRDRIRREIEEYNQSVPVYKQIKKIRFLEKAPEKTAMGKLIRRQVMEGEA